MVSSLSCVAWSIEATPACGRIERARLAHAVHADADAGAEPLCLLDRRGQLRLGVLVGRVQHAVNHAVRSGLVDLGEVRAFLVLLAHHCNDLVGGVGVVGVRQHVLRGIEVVGVLVPAQNVDGVGADAQARPGNDAPG